MEIVNRVAQSGIITLDPAMFLPEEPIVVFDIKHFLFREMILKEKEYREALKNLDLQPYTNKVVTVTCSTDATLPQWALMLAASILQPVAKKVLVGDAENALEKYILSQIDQMNVEEYTDARIVLKGCGDKSIPAGVYALLTSKLQPVVKTLMYGEPCSTVPIYKKK